MRKDQDICIKYFDFGTALTVVVDHIGDNILSVYVKTSNQGTNNFCITHVKYLSS